MRLDYQLLKSPPNLTSRISPEANLTNSVAHPWYRYLNSLSFCCIILPSPRWHPYNQVFKLVVVLLIWKRPCKLRQWTCHLIYKNISFNIIAFYRYWLIKVFLFTRRTRYAYWPSFSEIGRYITTWKCSSGFGWIFWMKHVLQVIAVYETMRKQRFQVFELIACRFL